MRQAPPIPDMPLAGEAVSAPRPLSPLQARRLRRRRRRRLILLVLLGLGTLSLPAWYIASPYWTLNRMRLAARYGDIDRLSPYINSWALSLNFRADLQPRMEEVIRARKQGDPADRTRLAASLSNYVAAQLCTPELLLAMLDGRHIDHLPREPLAISSDDSEISHDGLNAFTLHRRGNPTRVGDLVFERSLLSWRLVRVQVTPSD